MTNPPGENPAEHNPPSNQASAAGPPGAEPPAQDTPPARSAVPAEGGASAHSAPPAQSGGPAEGGASAHSAPPAQSGGPGRSAWVDGVRLAFGTLTVLPAGVPRRVDRGVGGRAMVLAPLVGLVVGGVAAGVVGLAQLVRPDADLLAAVLAVLVVAALSGGLHLDGLADFADALGSRRHRETMLRIMKQSDIGPFGVVAIAGVLLLDVAALTACVQAGFGWQAVLIGTVASRLTLPWSCRTSIPAARPDGLGTVVAATVRRTTATLTTVLALAATIALTWLQPAASTPPAAGWQLIGVGIAVLLAVVTSILTSRQATKKLGGTTGDVLGATVELALPVALLTLALTV